MIIYFKMCQPLNWYRETRKEMMIMKTNVFFCCGKLKNPNSNRGGAYKLKSLVYAISNYYKSNGGSNYTSSIALFIV